MGVRLDDPRTIAARRQPHWLYRLYDADGVLLYIGQTRNPAQRFRGWLSDHAARGTRASWFDEAVRVDWRRYPNYGVVIAAEKLAIETERPLHNRQHQPQRVA